MTILWLQAFHVLSLAGHDWVELGRWNDVEALRRMEGTAGLVRIMSIWTLPFSLLLAALCAWGVSACRGVLLVGETRAWWWPYLVGPAPARWLRCRAMSGGTHAFLPERFGIVPNALLCPLHAATFALVVSLCRGN